MSDRSPPHRLDAERAVLGSVLFRPSVLDEVDLHPAEFFLGAHGEIWTAMRVVADRNRGRVDVILLGDELRRAGTLNALEGGEGYLTGLTDIPTAEGAQHWASLVRRTATLRRAISLGSELQARAWAPDADPEALMADVRREMAVIEQVGMAEDVRVGDRLQDVIAGIEARAAGKRGEFSVPTGIATYDERVMHSGGKLIVVGGPPSHGKTALAGGWAAHAAIAGYPTLVFSLEMTEEEIIHRFLAGVSDVAASDMAAGTLDYGAFRKVMTGAEQLRAPDLFVVTEDDTFARIRARIRRWHARRVVRSPRRLGLVAVDYLQLVAGEEGSRNREREVAQMSRGFKRLALELRVPIVLLSQLSRKYAERGEEVPPQISDLRDSGQIEQDADIIVFPWRKPYDSPDRAGKLWNDACPADLIVAKNRGGRKGKVPAWWTGPSTTFRNLPPATGPQSNYTNWQDQREDRDG